MAEEKANSENSTNTFKTANDYANALRDWMTQYNVWHQTQMFNMTFPYYMMGCMSAQSINHPITGRNTAPIHPTTQTTPTQPQRHRNAPPHREFRIAPIWKRFAAELLDFFILLALKISVTIVAVKEFNLIDLDKYEMSLDNLFNQDMHLDYSIAFNETCELVALEVLNRVFITLFEAICLRRSVAGALGGATPGKRVMGIYVVSCEQLVVDLGHDRVRVTPGANIGFWNALVRSMIKNFSMAFFIPVCFTAMFFQHHRAAYDVIANCIVVEPVPRRR